MFGFPWILYDFVYLVIKYSTGFVCPLPLFEDNQHDQCNAVYMVSIINIKFSWKILCKMYTNRSNNDDK